MRIGRWPVAAILACWMSVAANAAPEGIPFGRSLLDHAIAERLAGGGRVTVSGRDLAAPDLRALYAPRDYAPLWVGRDGPSPRVRELLDALAGAGREGLVVDDYYRDEIDNALVGTGLADRVAAELLLSAAAMRYGADVAVGRIDPRRLTDQIDFGPRSIDRPALALTAATTPDVDAYLNGLAPARPAYDDLRRALAQYRELAAAGGWPTVPDGPLLRPGDAGDRAPALRARLEVTGDWSAHAAAGGDRDAPVHDEALVAAVERFQARHGLAVDGIVGPRTLAALNVPATVRVGQIVATMERWRWLPDALGNRHLLVNVPDFSLTVVDNEQAVRRMKVIVGRPTRPTPLFSSDLTWMEFNPTWTMPTSIAEKDYLPVLLDDPGYLADHNIRLYSGWQAGADELSATDIDWSLVGRGIRGMMLRQEPGSGNALGKVKFMMANRFSVYLHDTPGRSLFSRDVRTFSSGCIRLAEPLWLADYLLDGAARWRGTRRASILDGWDTTRMSMPASMPLHVVYVTAWIDDQGRMNFRDDIYDIDSGLLDALAVARPPHQQLVQAD